MAAKERRELRDFTKGLPLRFSSFAAHGEGHECKALSDCLEELTKNTLTTEAYADTSTSETQNNKRTPTTPQGLCRTRKNTKIDKGVLAVV